MKHVYRIFYHRSGLTRNLMFNGSIYFVLYLQMLGFYVVGQIYCFMQFVLNLIVVKIVIECNFLINNKKSY